MFDGSNQKGKGGVRRGKEKKRTSKKEGGGGGREQGRGIKDDQDTFCPERPLQTKKRM